MESFYLEHVFRLPPAVYLDKQVSIYFFFYVSWASSSCLSFIYLRLSLAKIYVFHLQDPYILHLTKPYVFHIHNPTYSTGPNLNLHRPSTSTNTAQCLPPTQSYVLHLHKPTPCKSTSTSYKNLRLPQTQILRLPHTQLYVFSLRKSSSFTCTTLKIPPRQMYVFHIFNPKSFTCTDFCFPLILASISTVVRLSPTQLYVFPL